MRVFTVDIGRIEKRMAQIINGMGWTKKKKKKRKNPLPPPHSAVLKGIRGKKA